MDILLLIAGLVVLVVGGEFLVRGAVGIAKLLHLSPLIIGLTVVSFGTSAPELLVSVQAAMDGSPGIAIGNVMGSNIANIALVLGVTVLIFPIIVDRQTKIIDWPFMMLVSLVFFVFSMDMVLELWEGLTLLAMLITFTIFLIRKSRKENKRNNGDEKSQDEDAEKTNPGMSILFLFAGLVGLYFGSEWLVEGATSIASSMGMEDHVIGLTIVAFGTSTPELVASCVAAFRKQTDISVGNLVGSNIFNICAVLGTTATVKEVAIDEAVLQSDMYWMLGISLVLLPMMLIGLKLGRLKGLILLSSYIVYISLLVINSKP